MPHTNKKNCSISRAKHNLKSTQIYTTKLTKHKMHAILQPTQQPWMSTFRKVAIDQSLTDCIICLTWTRVKMIFRSRRTKNRRICKDFHKKIVFTETFSYIFSGNNFYVKEQKRNFFLTRKVFNWAIFIYLFIIMTWSNVEDAE